MRLIVKQTEPATVRDTRLATTTNLSTPQTARAAFNQCEKQAVRDRLVAEQHHLCAFCMRSIEPKARLSRPISMKIAHRTPIEVQPSLALTWSNMLGACLGGEKTPGFARTCDTAQGNRPLSVDPTSPQSVSRISYESRPPRTGLFITSDDPALRAELGAEVDASGDPVPGVLNLNGGDLPELRALAWKAFCDQHHQDHPKGPWGKAARREFLPKYLAKRAPRLPEMFGVIEFKLA